MNALGIGEFMLACIGGLAIIIGVGAWLGYISEGADAGRCAKRIVERLDSKVDKLTWEARDPYMLAVRVEVLEKQLSVKEEAK